MIENRDAKEVMAGFDTPSTLFYIDPPYVASTRSSLNGRGSKTHGYRHEMTKTTTASWRRSCTGRGAW